MTSDGFTENLCLAFGSAGITNDMWFYFFAPSTGPMRIQTCGSLFDTKVGIYDNFCPVGNNSASIIACNGHDACGTQSIVNFQAIAGHDYGVRVGSFPGRPRTGTIIVLCPADFKPLMGSINVQDIFDFLAAWFAGNPAANTNGVSGINIQDIFDFLALSSPAAKRSTAAGQRRSDEVGFNLAAPGSSGRRFFGELRPVRNHGKMGRTRPCDIAKLLSNRDSGTSRW